MIEERRPTFGDLRSAVARAQQAPEAVHEVVYCLLVMETSEEGAGFAIGYVLDVLGRVETDDRVNLGELVEWILGCVGHAGLEEEQEIELLRQLSWAIAADPEHAPDGGVSGRRFFGQRDTRNLYSIEPFPWETGTTALTQVHLLLGIYSKKLDVFSRTNVSCPDPPTFSAKQERLA